MVRTEAEIAHLIPSLGPGGPARSLAVLVALWREACPGIRHRVVPIDGAMHAAVALKLRRAGAELTRGPDHAAILAALGTADLVLLHFWNTPVIWRLLARGLPSGRYVVWSKVEGSHAPQRLGRALVTAAHASVLTAPAPLHLREVLADTPLVPGLVETDRVAGVRREPHSGFHADYIGTTSSGKLHPRFFAIMDRLEIPDCRVRVFGGALEPSQAKALAATRAPDRFECGGFVENIAAVLATSDVFAYPLAPWTYASSDKALQEAMLAGVPPVVLGHAAPNRFVADGRTGIVAGSEAEFVSAIEWLHRHPERRRQMGDAARAAALTAFDPRPGAARLLEVVENALARPRRPFFDRDGDTSLSALPDSALFLVSQGWSASEASESVGLWLSGGGESVADNFSTSGDETFQLEGGVLHWRNAAPRDPLLRFWTAGWLQRCGRAEEARRELTAAMHLGASAAAAVAALEP